jgi:catechol 2,3-dioxygenase-like lactoylglutathione lyase family enzyme
MPLTSGTLVGLVPTTDSARAKAFYVDTLGLTLVSDDQFAVVVRSGANQVRIVKVQSFTPQPFTVLGWAVEDVRGTVRDLAARGVQFLRFEGMEQDEDGIWNSPGGGGVAWFNDPDGNTLSVSRYESTEARP